MARKKRKETEADFWREDAERVNGLCKIANKMGVVVPTKAVKPPKLNADGSLAEKKKKSKRKQE